MAYLGPISVPPDHPNCRCVIPTLDDIRKEQQRRRPPVTFDDILDFHTAMQSVLTVTKFLELTGR